MSSSQRVQDDAFMLAEWLVEPGLNRMSQEEVTHKMEPRVMAVLVALAEHSGKPVSRDYLLEQVWSGVIVNEDALTRAVSELRKLLGDDPKQPRFVETIRKGGYRLLVSKEDVAIAEEGVVVEPIAETVTETESVVVAEEPTRRHMRWVAALPIVLVIGLGWFFFPEGKPTTQTSATAGPPVVRPFTTFPGEEASPALSADGSRVAYVWRADWGQTTDIFVKQDHVETPLQLTDHPGQDRYPVFSPDGNRIAFSREHEGDSALYTTAMIGGDERKLRDLKSRLKGLDWDPAGKVLIYSQQDQEQNPAFALYELDLESMSERLLVAPPTNLFDFFPRFSPSGSRIAFIRGNRFGLDDVFVVNRDGTDEKRLTFEGRPLRGLAWTSETELVFASLRSGTYSLWRLNMDTLSITWVPARGESIVYPATSRGSDHLIFQQQIFMKNIWKVDLDEGSEAPLITSTRGDCESHFAPDGSGIVFTSARSGHLELWTCRGDGSAPVRLTSYGGSFVGNPRYSPDSKEIAYYANHEGFSTIYVMDAEGGQARQVTDARSNAMVSAWSRDGKWLYYGGDRDGSWRIYKVPAAGGDPIVVTEGTGFQAMESRDGKRLFFSKPDENGVWERDVATGLERRIIDDLGQHDYANWYATEEGIFFVRRGDGAAVWFHEFATGEIREMAKVPRMARPSLAVSPDGRHLLYARVENSPSDLMVISSEKNNR